MIISLRICFSLTSDDREGSEVTEYQVLCIRFCVFFSLPNIHKNSFRYKEKKEKFFFFPRHIAALSEIIFLNLNRSENRVSVKKNKTSLNPLCLARDNTRYTVPPALPFAILLLPFAIKKFVPTESGHSLQGTNNESRSFTAVWRT